MPRNEHVVAEPGKTAITERLMIANAHLLDDTPMIDLFDADRTNSIATFGPGFMTVTVPAETVLVLQPRERDHGGYSRYKRVP